MNYADMSGSILAGTNFVDVDLSKVKKSCVNSKPVVLASRRITKRYSTPRLFVKTPHGVFPTVNWSTSGICLSYTGKDRFEQDSHIQAKLVAEGYPPPRDTEFTVIKDDQSRGVVLLKFTCLDDAMAEYLDTVALDDII